MWREPKPIYLRMYFSAVLLYCLFKALVVMTNTRAELTACNNCTPGSFRQILNISCNLPVSGHTYHFFSGIGRGTAFTRQGKFGWPDRFLPRIVPTRFSGKMTKKQIQQTATCRKQKLFIFKWLVGVYIQAFVSSPITFLNCSLTGY